MRTLYFFGGLILITISLIGCGDSFHKSENSLDQISIQGKQLSSDDLLKNEGAFQKLSATELNAKRAELDLYNHYLLNIYIPPSHNLTDMTFFNFAFRDDIELVCGGESETPVLYINEGILPGTNGLNRIMIAFPRFDCADEDGATINISSAQIGLFQIDVTNS